MVSSTYDYSSDAPAATLRIHSVSGVPVEQVQVFLARLVRSYNSIYVFDSIIRQLDLQRLTVREFGPDLPYRAYRLGGRWALLPGTSLDVFNIPFDRVSE